MNPKEQALFKLLLVNLTDLVRCIRGFKLGDYSALMDEIFDSEDAIKQANRYLHQKRKPGLFDKNKI